MKLNGDTECFVLINVGNLMYSSQNVYVCIHFDLCDSNNVINGMLGVLSPGPSQQNYPGSEQGAVNDAGCHSDLQ